uniref:Uncharacterized protein n=1 Tax=Panagrolaimus superbus TaxID=310955 RepID=A0A914XV27_9BILA
MKQHSSSRASVSPQRASPKHGSTEYSTPVKNQEAASYSYRTPTNRQNHPEGWDHITWAPKPCRKAIRRMNFDGATAAVAN